MSKLADISAENLSEHFEYLDELRESGETNMFGAGPYLQRRALLSHDTARNVVLAWMETFQDTPASARAAIAKAESKRGAAA